MVTVKVFNSREEAEVAKSFLASQGIDSQIRADDQGGMRPFLAFAAGVDLMVEARHVKRARELLEDPETAESDEG